MISGNDFQRRIARSVHVIMALGRAKSFANNRHMRGQSQILRECRRIIHDMAKKT